MPQNGKCGTFVCEPNIQLSSHCWDSLYWLCQCFIFCLAYSRASICKTKNETLTQCRLCFVNVESYSEKVIDCLGAGCLVSCFLCVFCCCCCRVFKKSSPNSKVFYWLLLLIYNEMLNESIPSLFKWMFGYGAQHSNGLLTWCMNYNHWHCIWDMEVICGNVCLDR